MQRRNVNQECDAEFTVHFLTVLGFSVIFRLFDDFRKSHAKIYQPKQLEIFRSHSIKILPEFHLNQATKAPPVFILEKNPYFIKFNCMQTLEKKNW